MSYKYERERTQQIVSAIKAAGFRAFLAERGTYGFYTDADGSRVVSFQCDGLRDSVSGNYQTNMPQQTGTGWRISDDYSIDESALEAYFNQNPPRWAVGDAKWSLTTLEQHLKTYGPSSKYVEV